MNELTEAEIRPIYASLMKQVCLHLSTHLFLICLISFHWTLTGKHHIHEHVSKCMPVISDLSHAMMQIVTCYILSLRLPKFTHRRWRPLFPDHRWWDNSDLPFLPARNTCSPETASSWTDCSGTPALEQHATACQRRSGVTETAPSGQRTHTDRR